MKFKSGAYTGEKYEDGSLRIWKDGKLVCEFYISVTAGNERYCLLKKQFNALCAAIEENCRPYKGGTNDD